MSFPRKIASGAAAITLVAASSAVIGLVGAGTAAAASGEHCVLQDGKNYPPSKCYIVFDAGSYHRGGTVKFHGHIFGPGVVVHEHLKCGSLSKNLGTVTTGRKGIAKDSFTLPKSAPTGHCTLTLTGGGGTIKGGFTAKV